MAERGGSPVKGAGKRALRVFRTKEELDAFMVGEWAAVCRRAVARRGRFTAALSGGTTPVSFYDRLAARDRDLPWERTYIFLADERCVPFDHPDSNFGLIESKLLRYVPIPAGNIHAVQTRLEPSAAAAGYETEMRAFFGLEDGEFPGFDLILLGLGEDGHTASLFPGDAAVAETRRLAAAVIRAAPGHDRVTLTLPVINRASAVIFLVAGANKAAVLKSVIDAPEGGVPAALARSTSGRTLFLVDQEAGSQLSNQERRSAEERVHVL
jgi:6-phosphogluconolactonase